MGGFGPFGQLPNAANGGGIRGQGMSTFQLTIGPNWNGSDDDAADLQHLIGMSSLKLSGTAVCDAWLPYLSSAESLQTVRIDRTSVTAKGLGQLKDIATLRELEVNYCPIGADAAQSLCQMPQLKRLVLNGTDIGVKSDAASEIITALANTAVVIRGGGFLGVGPDANEQEEGGVRVRLLQPGSGAEKSGILIGDLITEFAGTPIDNFEQLKTLIGEKQVSDKVTVTVVRGQETLTKEVVLGENTAVVPIRSQIQAFQIPAQQLPNLPIQIRVPGKKE